MTPNGKFVYVAVHGNYPVHGHVAVIATASNTLKELPSQREIYYPERPAVDAKWKIYLRYEYNIDADSASVIETASNAFVGSGIPVGHAPRALALSPDGKFVYVANFYTNSISVIATSSNAVVGAPIQTGEFPLGVQQH